MCCDRPRRLRDDEWLSQVGQRRPDGSWNFRDRPRGHKVPPELELSMVLGRLSAAEAYRVAFGAHGFKAGRHAVRHVLVGDLRSAGFRVEHTPRHGGSLTHVSVFWTAEGWGVEATSVLNEACGEGET